MTAFKKKIDSQISSATTCGITTNSNSLIRARNKKVLFKQGAVVVIIVW